MKTFSASLLISVLLVSSAIGAVEEPIDSRFKPAQPDERVGDWQSGASVAQVSPAEGGGYQVNVFTQFDEPNARPLAVLHGEASALSGDGWTGKFEGRQLALQHGTATVKFTAVTRNPPTLGARPPAGAVVLFDGKNMDAFANKKGKEWLVENGPAPWKVVDGALEVVPGTGGGIITHQKFGDSHIHVEFRTLGAPTNSGVYLETRYEVNINEVYGQLSGSPTGGLDNASDVKPSVRASRPPLQWQTLDIDFTAPRFDASGKKTAPARATVALNGVELYHEQTLNPPKGAAGRLGEAPTGPLLLQEHGMPVQFRNIWVLPR